MQGYIKLYRKILENPVVTKDSDFFAVWSYLLLNASHNNFDVMFEGKKITLNPGQLITGRKSIHSFFSNISESKIQRILKVLENEHQIEQQTTPRNRLITIVNWNEYQQSEQQDEQQVNNKRTTNEQQVNTTKNVKKVKKVKNVKEDIYISEDEEKSISTIALFEKNQEEIVSKTKELYPDKNVDKAIIDFLGYIKSRNTKYRNFRQAFYNWVREDRFNKYQIINQTNVIGNKKTSIAFS